MEMNLKFKELKKYISVLDRISICMRETLRYENYRFLSDVPDKYDELYVYGIGMIDSEFDIENPEHMLDVKEKDICEKFYFAKCIEVVLAEKPRNEFLPECTFNEYAYARTRFPLFVDSNKAVNTSNEIDEKKFFEAVEVFCKEFPEEKRESNEAK